MHSLILNYPMTKLECAVMLRNTRIFSALWISVGIGLSGYYGLQWYEQPRWSEAEIEQSVMLNLGIDLARMGPHLRPTGEKLEQLHQMVRSEVEGQIRTEQRAVWRGLIAGSGMLLLGLVPLLYGRSRAKIPRTQRP